MAKIRHIAIATQKLDETVEFYQNVFGLKVVGRLDAPTARGALMTDGDLNLTLLDLKTDEAADHFGKDYEGLHHIGILVEDVEEVRRKLEEMGKEIRRPGEGAVEGDGVYFAFKSSDPNHVILDITAAEVGWPGAKSLD